MSVTVNDFKSTGVMAIPSRPVPTPTSKIQTPDGSVKKSVKQSAPRSQTDLQLEALFSAWADKRPVYREKLSTFLDTWKSNPVDLEAFTQAVLWRLDRFDECDEAEKQKFLGTLSGFLSKNTWAQELPPLEKPKVKGPTSHEREEFTYIEKD